MKPVTFAKRNALFPLQRKKTRTLALVYVRNSRLRERLGETLKWLPMSRSDDLGDDLNLLRTTQFCVGERLSSA